MTEEEAKEKARELFELDGIHRYIFSYPVGECHIGTLEEFDAGKFHNCEKIFSTYEMNL